MSPEDMDHFLCCGTTYQHVRFAVTKFILETRSEDIVTTMQVRHRWFSLSPNDH